MGRLLLADGDARTLERCERALSRRGHEVEVYREGRAALEALSELDRELDLVVWELRLGDVGGLELLRAAKEIRPSVPVVLTADCWLKEESDAALAQGARRLMTRPVAIEVLCEVARELGVPDGPLPERRPQIEAAHTVSLRHASPGAFDGWDPPGTADDPPPLEPQLEAGVDLTSDADGDALSPGAMEDLAPPQVLVCERDACARRLLSYCLDRQAIRVSESSSRLEACELAEMDTPDAIVLGCGNGDLSLSDTLARLRADRTLEAVPVIALYESGHTADAAQALDLGADVALETPYEPDVLFGHIRAAIRRMVRVRRLAVEAVRRRTPRVRRPAADRSAGPGPRSAPRAAQHDPSRKEPAR